MKALRLHLKQSPIRLLALLLAIVAPHASASDPSVPIGTKPSYIWGGVSSVPNQQAITKTIWAPGLDDGYVPQGLTRSGNAILIAGYKSTDTKIDKGPCRVYSVAIADGSILGYFDMPDDCGHAGGLAMISDSEIVVSDTRTLYKINLKRALAAKNTTDALLGVVKLSGGLKGSFVDFDGTDMWIGSSEKDPEKAKIYRLSVEVFNQFNGKAAIKENVALSSISIPIEANGLAFDSTGDLWLATSSSKYGILYRLHAKTGAIKAQFDMVIGIEDLGFDAQGTLWAVSEAGSKRWSKWAKTYPIIFQIDVSALK